MLSGLLGHHYLATFEGLQLQLPTGWQPMLHVPARGFTVIIDEPLHVPLQGDGAPLDHVHVQWKRTTDPSAESAGPSVEGSLPVHVSTCPEPARADLARLLVLRSDIALAVGEGDSMGTKRSQDPALQVKLQALMQRAEQEREQNKPLWTVHVKPLMRALVLVATGTDLASDTECLAAVRSARLSSIGSVAPSRKDKAAEEQQDEGRDDADADADQPVALTGMSLMMEEARDKFTAERGR